MHLHFQTSFRRKTFHLIVVVEGFVSSSRLRIRQACKLAPSTNRLTVRMWTLRWFMLLHGTDLEPGKPCASAGATFGDMDAGQRERSWNGARRLQMARSDIPTY